jgi:MreB/Mbl protein
MSRTFLPKFREDIGGVAPQNSQGAFVSGSSNLLVQVSTGMDVGTASSEARAPSPFARVWQFRRNLLGEAGEEEQIRAVETFRGILALFALREFYHLKIVADVTAPLTSGQKDTNRIPALFSPHITCVPESGRAEEARFLFGKRIVVFNLVEPEGTPPTVVAGYSPLTLVFPSARTLETSRALNAIFWYDRQSRRWHDPTVVSDRIPGRLSLEARQQLAVWLDDALRIRRADGQGLSILSEDKLPAASDQLITELLAGWRSNFEVPPSTFSGSVRALSLARSVVMAEVERNVGVPFPVPKLIEKVYAGGTDAGDPKGDRFTRPTDFRCRDGVIYLTLEESGNPSIRVYGTLFGSLEIRDRLKMSDAEGPNLGLVLQREGEAPVPYVILDNLFTPKLGRVQKGQNTIGSEWKALTLANNAATLDGIYLIPFEPAILRYFTPTELREGVVADNNVGAIQVTFEHRELPAGVRKYYAMEEIVVLDPSLDLRFFPKFRLDSVADVNLQLPLPHDRYYYARVRLSPALDEVRLNWLGEKGVPLNETPRIEGDYVRPNRETFAVGRRAFWRFPMALPPVAFEVEDHGLILLALEQLNHQGQAPSPWAAAVDFGTTNSCVAIDRGSGNVAETEKLPVLVTTFLQTWATALRGDSDEGYSALADFFFWQNTATQHLNERDFFPTQIITTNPLTLEKLTDDKFNPSNGLAFFPNVSLAAVENPGFTDLIEGFGGFNETAVKARFKLNRDLKWKPEDGNPGSSQIWRDVFHQHLRCQLILTAAREKATINRLVASYPKAFLPAEVTEYRQLLQKIWSENTPVELRSESVAAAMTLQITLHHEYFLVDMGGGTTDIAVFKDEEVEEECSFKLAGGLLEEYVVQSSNLRNIIARAFDVKGAIAKAFVANDKEAEFYKTFFQGFLAQRGTSALVALQKNGKDDRSTQGFFLTALVLYAGLSYFCGLWLKKRRERVKGIPAAEHLQWLGNGSSFIKMLTVGDKTFEEVLIRIFNKACNGSAEGLPLRTDAKTVVAKGLLKHAKNVKFNKEEAEVFSSLLSNSVAMNGVSWTENDSLSKFYQEFNPEQQLGWDGLGEGSTFYKFLDSLQTELPGGQYNRGTLVNPAVLDGNDRAHWVVDFIRANKAGVEKHFNTRLKENKRRWGGTLQAKETLYVEPVFISELAAVLAQIRAACA